MAGSFGYELDLNALTDAERAQIKEQIKKYKAYQSIIYGGKYYRLTNPFENESSFWEFVSEDDVLVHGIIFKSEFNTMQKALRLAGLDKNSTYINEETGEEYGGTALMCGGLLLPKAREDYSAVEFHLKKR